MAKVMSAIRLHDWAAEESEARRKDAEDSRKFLRDIHSMLEQRKTDIRTVIATLLPRARQHSANAKQVERARSEGSKAAALFAKEVEALRPSAMDPAYSVFQSVIDFAMDMFRNGEALPEGHPLPGDFFEDFPRQSNLLYIRVRDLETGSIVDNEIILRHHQTYENLIHELIRPRGPIYQPLTTHVRLYIRKEAAHQLTPRGLLWTPVKKKGMVVNILPNSLDGWHDVELVHSEQEYLIALVDDGEEEKGAVLDYTAKQSVAAMISAKWPHRKPTECLGLDISKSGYIIKLTDWCQDHPLEPYCFGLCFRFPDKICRTPYRVQ